MNIPKNYTLKEVKSFLKNLAIEIRIQKIFRKEEKDQIPLLKYFDEDKILEVKRSYDTLEQRKNRYRYNHIAYCLFRGRTYEQVESNSKKPVNFKLIDDIKNKIENAMMEVQNENFEDVRNCA